MKSHPKITAVYQLALVASCAVLCTIAFAASPFAPEQGLVLLKNGQVIEGGVLREGDRYVITLGTNGERGELKIPVNEVDTTCHTLEEAYAHKQRQIIHRSVKPHLELADWCLRNGLPDRAADELVAAMAIDAHDPKIAAIERRMRLAAAPKSTKPRPNLAIPTTQADIEATLKTLPGDVVEEFAKDIQPLLLSRCAVTACHGPSSTASYHLVRPPLKHSNKTRETQRNLFATLAQVTADGDSPLLTKPLDVHGGSETPVFDDHDRRQIELLAAWVERVKGSSKGSFKKEKTESFVRPAAFEEEVKPTKVPSIHRLPAVGEPRAFAPDTSAKPIAPKKPAPGKDPFDAEIFNNRYHKK